MQFEKPGYSANAEMPNVPTKYKQSGIGVIPNDWEIKPMRAFGKFEKGRGLLKEDIRSFGSIPAIPYTALYTDFSEIINCDEIKWFVDEPAKTCVVCEPCLLIASSSNMEANTGKACALIGTACVAIGREVIILKTRENCSFLSYLLSTSTYRRQTLILARGTTIKHLYPATFLDYKVALPCRSEQNAIADALSDVDGLLEALEALIVKKRAIKKAAMQQLLTGKTRLPGFSGKWETKQIVEVAEVKTGPFGSALHERDYVAEGTPIITVEHLGERDVLHSNLPMVSDADRERLRAYSLTVGDIVFSRVGSIDRNALIRDTEEGWLFSGRLLRLRPDRAHISSSYLNYHFHSEQFRTRIREVAVGQTMASLNTRIVQEAEVVLPCLSEQTAIAKILSDMDAEIAALEARRNKTRAIKQGMMQQLLTGRVRLVKPEQAEVNA